MVQRAFYAAHGKGMVTYRSIWDVPLLLEKLSFSSPTIPAILQLQLCLRISIGGGEILRFPCYAYEPYPACKLWKSPVGCVGPMFRPCLVGSVTEGAHNNIYQIDSPHKRVQVNYT